MCKYQRMAPGFGRLSIIFKPERSAEVPPRQLQCSAEFCIGPKQLCLVLPCSRPQLLIRCEKQLCSHSHAFQPSLLMVLRTCLPCTARLGDKWRIAGDHRPTLHVMLGDSSGTELYADHDHACLALLQTAPQAANSIGRMTDLKHPNAGCPGR